jgi:hypothetical protein
MIQDNSSDSLYNMVGTTFLFRNYCNDSRMSRSIVLMDLQVPLIWLFSLHIYLYMLQSICVDILVPSVSIWNEMMCGSSMPKQWSAYT